MANTCVLPRVTLEHGISFYCRVLQKVYTVFSVRVRFSCNRDYSDSVLIPIPASSIFMSEGGKRRKGRKIRNSENG